MYTDGFATGHGPIYTMGQTDTGYTSLAQVNTSLAQVNTSLTVSRLD